MALSTIRKNRERFWIVETKRIKSIQMSAPFCVILLLIVCELFYNYSSCWKLIRIQMLLDHINANDLHLLGCNALLSSTHKFISSSFIACIFVNLSILWNNCNILLVPSLINKLNEIFDTSSFYICIRMFLLLVKSQKQKNLPLQY